MPFILFFLFIYLFNPAGKYSRVSSTPERGDPPEYVCISRRCNFRKWKCPESFYVSLWLEAVSLCFPRSLSWTRTRAHMHTHSHTKNESKETKAEILAAFFHPLPVSPNMIWPYKDRLQWWKRTAEESHRISLHGWSNGQARGSKEKRKEGNGLGGVKRVCQSRKLLVQHMHAWEKRGEALREAMMKTERKRECCRKEREQTYPNSWGLNLQSPIPSDLSQPMSQTKKALRCSVHINLTHPPPTRLLCTVPTP